MGDSVKTKLELVALAVVAAVVAGVLVWQPWARPASSVKGLSCAGSGLRARVTAKFPTKCGQESVPLCHR